jgi:hypothetical protein
MAGYNTLGFVTCQVQLEFNVTKGEISAVVI